VEVWPSTQNVSGIAAQYGPLLKVPANNFHVHMDFMGGGFGSKFPADLWISKRRTCRRQQRQTVKMFLTAKRS